MSKIKTSLRLEKGTFTKAKFVQMMAKEPNTPLKVRGERLLIREEITLSPNILYLSGISHNLDEQERENAIASLNPSRQYFIEGSDSDDYAEGEEVLLDWAQAMNMTRVNGRSGTPSLIEAAASLDNLTVTESRQLDKLKDVTIYEYIVVWPHSVICVVGETDNPEYLFDKIAVTVAPELLKPSRNNIILPGIK